jgi:hypothetical protein
VKTLVELFPQHLLKKFVSKIEVSYTLLDRLFCRLSVWKNIETEPSFITPLLEPEERLKGFPEVNGTDDDIIIEYFIVVVLVGVEELSIPHAERN